MIFLQGGGVKSFFFIVFCSILIILDQWRWQARVKKRNLLPLGVVLHLLGGLEEAFPSPPSPTDPPCSGQGQVPHQDPDLNLKHRKSYKLRFPGPRVRNYCFLHSSGTIQSLQGLLTSFKAHLLIQNLYFRFTTVPYSPFS